MPDLPDLDPLDRLPGETRQANDALRDYYAMGSGRSLRALRSKYCQQRESAGGTKPPTTRFATLARWSTEYEWQQRINERARLDQERERSIREDALRTEAAKWAQRRIDVRERDWDQADRLRALADRILDETPKFLKTTRKFVPGRNGDPDREIITVGIDAKLMVQAMETASKLQRLAAEMETEHSLVESAEADDIEAVRRKRWEDIRDVIAEAIAYQEPEAAAETPETEADDGGADA